MNDLISEAFSQFPDIFYTSEKQTKHAEEIAPTLTGDLIVIKASLGGKRNEEESVTRKTLSEPLLKPPLLAKFLDTYKSCWVIEDFHKVDDNEKTKLSQIMKQFSDMAADYREIKIIAIGAVGTAREVVEYSPDMKNRVAEI
ncbi:MAG: hypothetical protein HQK89_13420 [Nitrospirae bacterium]|nr:hypothetical protein [Nitrospirota bacterium]